MVEPVSITVAAVVAGVIAGINLANREADIREKKIQFTQQTVEKLSGQGLNAVVVANGFKAQGFTNKTEKAFEGKTYTIFTAERDKTMIVERHGDGGYENWALQGTNWVRWDNIVKFHPHWDAGMGTPYEIRPKSHFPGW